MLSCAKGIHVENASSCMLLCVVLLQRGIFCLPAVKSKEHLPAAARHHCTLLAMGCQLHSYPHNAGSSDSKQVEAAQSFITINEPYRLLRVHACIHYSKLPCTIIKYNVCHFYNGQDEMIISVYYNTLLRTLSTDLPYFLLVHLL